MAVVAFINPGDVMPEYSRASDDELLAAARSSDGPSVRRTLSQTCEVNSKQSLRDA